MELSQNEIQDQIIGLEQDMQDLVNKTIPSQDHYSGEFCKNLLLLEFKRSVTFWLNEYQRMLNIQSQQKNNLENGNQ